MATSNLFLTTFAFGIWKSESNCMPYQQDERMFFYKAYKDIFELSQIEKYGFSKDIYGKNLAEHKCVTIHKYAFMESYFQPALREIVFHAVTSSGD